MKSEIKEHFKQDSTAKQSEPDGKCYCPGTILQFEIHSHGANILHNACGGVLDIDRVNEIYSKKIKKVKK